MKNKNEIIDFLLSRRSNSARLLKAPVPSEEDIKIILTAAARTPDHGKLEPWRFLIIEQPAMSRLTKAIEDRGIEKGISKEKLKKNASVFENAQLIIGVVASPKETHRIPVVEQYLSAGAVCLALLNSAHALGWGANWLTGWMAYDDSFLMSSLGLNPGEFIAGFIHLGTAQAVPVERLRPDISSLTTNIET